MHIFECTNCSSFMMVYDEIWLDQRETYLCVQASVSGCKDGGSELVGYEVDAKSFHVIQSCTPPMSLLAFEEIHVSCLHTTQMSFWSSTTEHRRFSARNL